jgi:hypothetical protein
VSDDVDDVDEGEPEEESPEELVYFGPARPSPERLPPWRVDPAADYDLLWRKVPHVPGFMQFARAIPGYVDHFPGRVPPEFTVQVEYDVTEVACPCGETPRLRRNIPMVCPCGRVFCDVAGEVRVGYVEDAVRDVVLGA